MFLEINHSPYCLIPPPPPPPTPTPPPLPSSVGTQSVYLDREFDTQLRQFDISIKPGLLGCPLSRKNLTVCDITSTRASSGGGDDDVYVSYLIPYELRDKCVCVLHHHSVYIPVVQTLRYVQSVRVSLVSPLLIKLISSGKTLVTYGECWRDYFEPGSKPSYDLCVYPTELVGPVNEWELFTSINLTNKKI